MVRNHMHGQPVGRGSLPKGGSTATGLCDEQRCGAPGRIRTFWRSAPWAACRHPVVKTEPYLETLSAYNVGPHVAQLRAASMIRPRKRTDRTDVQIHRPAQSPHNTDACHENQQATVRRRGTMLSAEKGVGLGSLREFTDPAMPVRPVRFAVSAGLRYMADGRSATPGPDHIGSRGQSARPDGWRLCRLRASGVDLHRAHPMSEVRKRGLV